MRGGTAATNLLGETDDDPAGLGLEVRAASGRAEVIDGAPVFGERLFAYYVLHNFGGWCTFCAIGARPLLEAAHVKPVREFPEIGMDPLNGVALCRNHHRGWDEGILRWSGGEVAVGAGAGGELGRLQGLLDPLLPVPRAPRHPLRPDALAWRTRSVGARNRAE